jgi:hypothetical protein
MKSGITGDHDSLHLGESIESMRQSLQLGDDAQADRVLQKELIPRCVMWVRHGRRISWQAAQDIVSQAFENVLDDLLSITVSPEEASLRLKTALNTARAEQVRRAAVEQSFGDFEPYEAAFRLYKEADFESLIDKEAEQAHREEHLLKVLEKLRGFMEISLEHLRPREYAILYDIYELGSIGMDDPVEPSPLPGLKPVARRVAIWRARRHFIEGLDQLLREACKSLKDEAAVLEGVTKLIEGGHLADALAVQHRGQTN